MFKFKANLSVFMFVIFYVSSIFSKQAEHSFDFDENLRYQFIAEQNLVHQLDKNSFALLPFQPLLQGMLEGIHPYQLLLSDEQSESPYFVIKSTASYVYIVGKPNQDQLDKIMNELSEFNGLVLICDESLHTYFVQHGFSLHPRIEFEYQFDHQVIQKEVPAGFTVKLLDLQLFKQSPWFSFVSSLHASSKRFLEVGLGYALVDEQGISVAQAYGAMLGNGSCEIGIITHPDYRGKGYILHPVTALIQECLARGLTPVWSCNSENVASLKTALKLGFKIKRHYAFLKKFN
ncbi:MAG: GNAT family N-acetyltransferase [Candidatus Dependentiae bacterium]|nr:GNAT family N-acetyltransferase [Candidatus Dependentiae bacterium]